MRYSLRLEMKLNTGVHYYSEYKDFHIAGESREYMLVSIDKKMAGNVNYFLKVGSIFVTPDKDQKYKCGTRVVSRGFWDLVIGSIKRSKENASNIAHR